MQHEEFAKLIEDDEEFEAQEAWLEESQEFFMNLETDTKLYLYSTEELQGNVPVNSKETLSSDTENFTKSNTPSKLRVESNNMSDTVVDNVIKETKTLDINTAKLIEDDEEFEAQEAWLEESQEFFMNLETDTKLYLYSTEELQGNVPVNSKETLSSDTENFTKSNTPSKLRVESNNMSDTVVDNVIKETKTLDINTSIDKVREIVRALVKC